MSIYRELHLDSAQNGRTSGSISKPEWQFMEPVYMKKFCVKHVSIPLSFPNIYQESYLVLNVRTDDGPGYASRNVDVPIDTYDSTKFAELLQNAFDTWTKTNGTTHEFTVDVDVVVDEVTLEEEITLQLLSTTNPIDVGKVEFQFAQISDDLGADNFSILQRFLGYGTTKGGEQEPALETWVELPLPAFTQTTSITNPLKFSLPNYLMMRSTLGSGSRFCPHIRGRAYDRNGYEQGGFNSSDIIAKIPIQAEVVEYGSQSAHRNLNFDATLMHEYNGDQLDKMSIYFTYPNSETVVDFGVFNFSVTIAFLADRV